VATDLSAGSPAGDPSAPESLTPAAGVEVSAPVIPVAREQPGSGERTPGMPAGRYWTPRRLATVGIGFALATGVLLRFLTSSHLWLDETLTVNIAHSPLAGGSGPDLFDRLRHDGAPPLFYVLLHFWMQVAGTSEIAVRALAGLLSVATLPLAWLAGRRVGRAAAQRYGLGPAVADRTALAALLLFASSPYAIRYASEARMYSLVVFLVLAFGLLLVRAVERPGWGRWVPLGLTTVAMIYTHYWTFLLLGSVAAGLAWKIRQLRESPAQRRPYLCALVAMLVSGLLFVPWLPSFAYQLTHTGTPWAPTVHAQVLLDTVFNWAGPSSTGALLALALLGSAFLGFTATPDPQGGQLHVDLRGRTPGRALAAFWLVPLALAYLLYVAGGSAYAERYTGISLPAFLLLAALGIGLLPSRRVQAGFLAVATVSGLLGGFTLARGERTQAGQIAGQIDQLARPGDVVAYCPDQLAPAVHRSLERRAGTPVQEIAFADPDGPAYVDWVDYAKRMKAATASDFAERVNRLAGPDHAIFFVRADGYRTLEGACASVSDQLASFRDRTLVLPRKGLLESAALERFSTTS
jgi:mannosyltransferase